MNCAEFKTGCKEYLEELFSPEERRPYDAHVAECPDCRSIVEKSARMSCRELAEFLDDYLDGALDADLRATFDEHVGICPDCEEYLRSYELTRSLSAESAAHDTPPEDVPEPLIEAILKARESP